MLCGFLGRVGGGGNGGRQGGGGGRGGSTLTSIKLTVIGRMEVVRSPVKRSSSVTSTGEPSFWFGGNFFFFFLIKHLLKMYVLPGLQKLPVCKGSLFV